MTRERATAFGLAAVAIWSVFVLLVVLTKPIPPFQLNTLLFGIGGIAGLAWTTATGRLHTLRQVPWPLYAIGIGGIFGYHVLYFNALRVAPPAEVMLVGYVWPLLIVLGSALLPGERLRMAHVIGGSVAFAGAALVVGGGGFDAASLPGYGLALAAATVWAGYSLAARRYHDAPTDAVGVFCLGTAVLSLPLHLLLETTVAPASPYGWAALLALGIGPVGFAYFAWDIGMKRGNVQLLGVASYATPLLATLALVLTGVTEPQPILILSALLISGGALLAARGARGGRAPA